MPREINVKPKPITEISNGYNMDGSIELPPETEIDAGWWSVDHQTTDFLMMGIFTTPIITNIDISRSAFSKLEKDPCKVKIPKYIINNISVDVIRASHCHHVPHVGMPHIDPENIAINVIIAPIGAADLIK